MTEPSSRLTTAPALTGTLVLAALVAVLGVAWRANRPAGPASAKPAYAAWQSAAPAIEPHRESASAVLDGQLYVFGGHYNERVQTTVVVQVFDPRTGRWSRRVPLPAPTTHWNAATDGRTVWLAGGFVGDHPGPVTQNVWQYDVATDRWVQAPPLPEPRGGGVLFLLDSALHYVGGFLPDRRTNSPDHWRRSLGSGASWEPRAPLPQPRGQLGGVVLDGFFYAIGGQFGHDGGSHDLPLVHRYDPVRDRWSEVAPLPRPVSHAEPSTFALDAGAMVIGGRDHEQEWKPEGWWLSSLFLFDPARNIWLALDELPHPLTGSAAAVIGNDLIVSAGGTGPGEVPVRDTWRLQLRDSWRPRPDLPVALGEVAAGVIGRHLYVVGDGSKQTMRFDLSRGVWADPGSVMPRPYPGDHHAAEVLAERLYLFGGFGAEGRTQIYDPAVNAWHLGAPMPFATGSSASAVIGGRIYVAGGIASDTTTPEAAVYDPRADSWKSIAPMPVGRNHAASATDGHRLYVFGGRGKGSGDRNSVANGFDEVQIYDPTTDRWTTSRDSASGIPPLPQARGGMGKAVHVRGRFYVLGGETRDGPGATAERVYARVDIYDPARRKWTTGRDMPVPRHGIFPVEIAGRIFVAGGGTRAGRSGSIAFDYYTPPADSLVDRATVSARQKPAVPRPAPGLLR